MAGRGAESLPGGGGSLGGGGAALGAGEAAGALAAVLHALRLHGQHEANQAALLALAVQVFVLNIHYIQVLYIP